MQPNIGSNSAAKARQGRAQKSEVRFGRKFGCSFLVSGDMDHVASSGESGIRAFPHASSAIRFPNWKEALSASALPAALKSVFCREILAFLHHCKAERAAATVTLAQAYLEARERHGSTEARPALRWFFRAGRAPPSVAAAAPTAVRAPGPTAGRPGDEGWERPLITAIRTAGLLWRTEETYRGWARRFVRFVAPRSSHPVRCTPPVPTRWRRS